MADVGEAGLQPVRRRRAVTVVMVLTLGLTACTTTKRSASPTAGKEQPPPAVGATPPPTIAQRAKTSLLPASSVRLISNFDGPLAVPAGQSIMLRLNSDAGRVSIADPEVAEVVLISPREVVINGKGRKVTKTSTNAFTGATSSEDVVTEAQTSVIVWDRNGRADVRTLYVNRARQEQILLEVTVADVNRTATEAYGFDFQVLQSDVLVTGSPAKLANFTQLRPGTLNPLLSPVAEQLNVNAERVTYMVQDFNNDVLAFIEMMQRENLAKILARPMILAKSGEEAHFRVGGEVPVVYATQNVAQINFKEFGVLLSATPTLTDDGQIDLRISTEVSEPSAAFRTAVVEGFQIPSFISRRAETRVQLRENEPLLIGGLYREDVQETEDKVPYIGDVPYLGAFFRRTRVDSSRNELLILVKPRVARSPQELIPTALPTDRPPLTRSEVRTNQQNPHEVTRPRLLRGPGPAAPPPPLEPGASEHSVDSYLPPRPASPGEVPADPRPGTR